MSTERAVTRWVYVVPSSGIATYAKRWRWYDLMWLLDYRLCCKAVDKAVVQRSVVVGARLRAWSLMYSKNKNRVLDMLKIVSGNHTGSLYSSNNDNVVHATGPFQWFHINAANFAVAEIALLSTELVFMVGLREPYHVTTESSRSNAVDGIRNGDKNKRHLRRIWFQHPKLPSWHLLLLLLQSRVCWFLRIIIIALTLNWQSLLYSTFYVCMYISL